MSLLNAVEPRVVSHPERAVSSLAPDACELAQSCGLVLDPWQADVLHDGLALRDDDKWAASDVDLIASRQNGKNGTIEVRELYGLAVLGEWFIHTAHLFKTTRESFNRLEALIKANDDVAAEVTQRFASPASGYDLRFRNGGRIQFIARSNTSGRGLTGDVLVIDEAQDLNDDALGALLPTISARPNSQTWYLGSAPGPTSVVWHRRRKQGRSGGSPRLAFFEYSAHPDADLDDRDAWREGNPGFGIRITEEAIEAERLAMSDEMFARERLSISPDLITGIDVLPEEDWNLCADPGSQIVSVPVFAVDVTPDRSWTSIGVAGTRSDGTHHIEVVERQPGTGWVAQRLAELSKHQGRIICDPKGPAGSLISEAEALGVTIDKISVEQHAQACGLLYDFVVQHRLRHLRQPPLEAALVGAEKRTVGDAWLWNRKSSSVDISPLVAVTLALWGAMKPVEESEAEANLW